MLGDPFCKLTLVSIKEWAVALSENNKHHLALLKDIFEVSQLCSTRTYIWAGLVQDILMGEFLCDHGDVDGFTLNLWDLKDEMAALYKQRGYEISFYEDVNFLKIERDGEHAVFNQLELDGEIARWRHAGVEGTVYFPARWLSDMPQSFFDTKAFVSGIEFEYSIKTHPHLLGPEWKGREKDIATINWLHSVLEEREIDSGEILKQIWSYTPFWVKKGYKEYSMPSVAWELEPIS
jgi:hypothetical protein